MKIIKDKVYINPLLYNYNLNGDFVKHYLDKGIIKKMGSMFWLIRELYFIIQNEIYENDAYRIFRERILEES